MSFLRSLVKSPITWALVIWAIDVFGWIPFWSAHVDPFLSHVFSPYYGLADWWGSVKSLISMTGQSSYVEANRIRLSSSFSPG